MRASNVLGAIILVLIILNAAISGCRSWKVEGSYMWVSVLGATVLVLVTMNAVISACSCLKVEGSYLRQ